MDRDVIAVFRDVADRSPEERQAYYTRRGVTAALRAEVESLLQFDGATLDTADARVAAAAYALLQHGTHSSGAPETRVTDANLAPAPALPNGVVFGPYRIVRPLGRGGMGIVYEADEIESGRRVALKVLARLTQPSERERFEREGRLAASVNHPHCVFVFSASEIHGHPVIAMEVMRGTLADRLEADGALAPGAAVDAILQLITGLEAAAAAGILHRDIKPSNCFVDTYGTVKIGDFGISRSLRPTQETALSTCGHRPATPAYASPEQLRGAPVDVRSDIYSVGATLYELLTGRRPFEGSDLMALLMAVANDMPTAPHLVAPGVPKGLGAIALRCLAKQPEKRFPDYQTLAVALEPYCSTAPTPATLGKRWLAGCVDLLPLMLLNMLVNLWWGPSVLEHTPLLVMTAVNLLYFVGLEVRWQATLGKAVCGLLVVRQDGGRPTIPSVIIRAGVFVMIPSLALQLLMLLGPDWARSQRIASGFDEGPPDTFRIWTWPDSVGFMANGLNFVMLGFLFSTARRRNGYAGLHDLLSGTRVVERRAHPNRRVTTTVLAEAQPGTIRRVGPFRVTSSTVPGMPEGWRSGLDERLARPVWIRDVPPGTPPISSGRAAVNRPTRLRWIAGRRTEHEAWDAFEAVPGMALDRAVTERRSWEDVRGWLLDLARECEQESTADQPPRRPDRVWVLDAGGAKLVDDPALDAPDRAPDPVPVAAFLLDVVRAARQAPPERRGRRSPKAPPWPVGVHRFLDRLNAQPTPTPSAIICELETLMRHPPSVTRGWRAMSLGVPVLLPAVLVPAVFIPVLHDATTTMEYVRTLLLAFMYVACFALVTASIFRGGVIRLLGLEFVTADGRRASRLRVLSRTAAAWAPVLIVVPVASSTAPWLVSSCLLLVFAGAVVAILNPERGIQDRLAGTWIVPR